MSAATAGSVCHNENDWSSAHGWGSSAYKDNDRKALRHQRSLEGMGLLESKANTTEIGFKPTE